MSVDTLAPETESLSVPALEVSEAGVVRDLPRLLSTAVGHEVNMRIAHTGVQSNDGTSDALSEIARLVLDKRDNPGFDIQKELGTINELITAVLDKHSSAEFNPEAELKISELAPDVIGEDIEGFAGIFKIDKLEKTILKAFQEVSGQDITKAR